MRATRLCRCSSGVIPHCGDSEAPWVRWTSVAGSWRCAWPPVASIAGLVSSRRRCSGGSAITPPESSSSNSGCNASHDMEPECKPHGRLMDPLDSKTLEQQRCRVNCARKSSATNTWSRTCVLQDNVANYAKCCFPDVVADSAMYAFSLVVARTVERGSCFCHKPCNEDHTENSHHESLHNPPRTSSTRFSEGSQRSRIRQSMPGPNGALCQQHAKLTGPLPGTSVGINMRSQPHSAASAGTADIT